LRRYCFVFSNLEDAMTDYKAALKKEIGAAYTLPKVVPALAISEDDFEEIAKHFANWAAQFVLGAPELEAVIEIAREHLQDQKVRFGNASKSYANIERDITAFESFKAKIEGDM
jgi:hypothetical protein